MNEYIIEEYTMVNIFVTSKGLITKFPESKPLNVYTSNSKPGIKASIRKKTPIQRILLIKKEVTKFSLMVKKLRSIDERNTAIESSTNTEIKYIGFVGREIPPKMVNTKYPTNILCINLVKNFPIYLLSQVISPYISIVQIKNIYLQMELI